VRDCARGATRVRGVGGLRWCAGCVVLRRDPGLVRSRCGAASATAAASRYCISASRPFGRVSISDCDSGGVALDGPDGL